MSDKQKKIEALLKKLPTSPGVYLMKNANDDVIYAGKAKNLKNRVKSYFQQTDKQGIKTQKLVENIENIDWVEVNSETESLVLETNYIKEYRPKYNILMKDDKNFVYVKIDQKEDYPQIQIVREMKKDGAKYFGPKTSKGKLLDTIEFLQKVFPIHYCKNDPGKPCIEYQMRKTFGPCLGEEGREKYRHYIQKIIEFFQGNYEKVLEDVKDRMMQAAKDQQFEKAAKYRDVMLSIESVQNKQIVSDTSLASQDIIGVFHDLGKTFVSLFQVRAGKMIHNENYTLENEGSFDEMIQAFLTNFYEHAADMPKEILIPKESEIQSDLEAWFEEKLLSKVKILTPQKGKKNELVELAMSNAKGFAERERARWMSDKIRKDQAQQDILGLINQDLEEKDQYVFPKRMECFDISHFQGSSTVASMVVFLDGEEAKSEYRRYKLKTLEDKKIDDFASMEEVLGRRLSEIENTLNIEAQGDIDPKYELRKLKKKEVKEWIFGEKKEKKKKVKKDEKQEKKEETPVVFTYYALFDTSIKKEESEKSIVFWGAFKKHDTKIFELKEEKGNTEERKTFFLALYQQLQGKDLWGFGENLEQFESLGFKKLKTLEKNWQEKPGLVPESIAEESELDNGYAFKIRIPKKKKEVPSIPDLMLIDGGKGQLSSVVKVFEEMEWKYKNSAFWLDDKTRIMVCSLAKKEEEVFFPEEKEPRILSNTTEGSYLLQRLRDEAHRFAITYNRDSREKVSMQSELDAIPGIGAATKKKLLKNFGSVAGVKKASKENLELCVGENLAKTISQHFQKQ